MKQRVIIGALYILFNLITVLWGVALLFLLYSINIFIETSEATLCMSQSRPGYASVKSNSHISMA